MWIVNRMLSANEMEKSNRRNSVHMQIGKNSVVGRLVQWTT